MKKSIIKFAGVCVHTWGVFLTDLGLHVLWDGKNRMGWLADRFYNWGGSLEELGDRLIVYGKLRPSAVDIFDVRDKLPPR